MKPALILRIGIFLALVLGLSQGSYAQQVARINPALTTLRAVSMASLETAIMVGDSNYVAITHSAYDLTTSPSFVALQSPFAPSTMLDAVAYAGDTLHAVIAGANGSLAWTSDDGASWTAVNLGTKATIRAVSWNGSNASPILVGVGDGGLVIRSNDRGQTWTSIAAPTSMQLNAVTFGTPTEAVAVGNDTTMIQSHDGGQTWLPMAFPYNFHTWYNGAYEKHIGTINFTGVAMAGADSVWVCFDTAMLPLLVCKGGAADTSQAFFNGLFTSGNIPVWWPVPGGQDSTYPSYTSVIYVGIPNTCLTYTAVVGDYVCYTVNSDNNINESPLTGIGDANGSSVTLPIRIRALGLWKQGATGIILMVGDELSIYQAICTPSGRITYTRAFFPYPGKTTRAEFIALSILPNGYGYAAATGDVFVRTTDSGKTWTYLTIPLAYPAAIDNVYTLDTSTVIIVGWNGIILRSNGAGYDTLPSGSQERLEAITFPSPDTGIIVGDYGMVLQSSDRGKTWKTINTSCTQRLYSVAFANSEIGIAAGDSATLLRTTDAGKTWSAVNHFLSGTNTPFLHVEGFPNGTFFVQAENELLRSVDFGQNWASILPPNMSDTTGMGFYSPEIGMIADHSASSQFVPDTAHLAYTTNGGSTWTRFSIPFWNDNRIIINWISGHEAIIYGSFGFIDDIVISSSGVQVTRVDQAPRLAVYPNPTTGNIRVDYTTKTSGQVTIQLFSEDGKELGMLFSGSEMAGAHEQSLTLPQNVRGICFIRLSSDGTSSTTKLTLQ